MSAPEIIDIAIDKIDVDNEPKKLSLNNSNESSKSVNFGPGVEMLMNHKKKDSSDDKNDSELNDLDKLESELNDLTDNETTPTPKISISTNDNSSGIKLNNENIKLNFDEPNKKQNVRDETWDGYKKFNEIPVNPTVDIPSKKEPMSKEEKLKKKYEILRKLDKLEAKGAKLSKQFTIESSLEEMECEHENVLEEKEKSNSIKFQGKMMVAFITALEFLNSKFDPFDIKLDGWTESVNENLDDYDEIFSELHEKYKSKARMSPELKLLFQLGGSAVMLHMTNTMFKSSMPGMDDIMRQNPDLMNQFKQAAVNTMGENNPGFGDFMGGLMNNGPGQTQQSRPKYKPTNTHQNDVGMNRGVPDFDDSVNVNQGFGSYDTNKRPDMKGPSDISDLLGNIKSKEPAFRSSKPRQSTQPKQSTKDNGSTISIDELMSIQRDADNVPRKSKRRPKSEKNTISLDI
tara:strand:- start:191 stop:1567 length:1377 start_codon:yes stop_codon:yes gene_type:complete